MPTPAEIAAEQNKATILATVGTGPPGPEGEKGTAGVSAVSLAGTYRNLAVAGGTASALVKGGTKYILTTTGLWVTAKALSEAPPLLVSVTKADLAVEGFTNVQLRTRLRVAVGEAALGGCEIQPQLFPVTIAAGIVTLGAGVAKGSVVTGGAANSTLTSTAGTVNAPEGPTVYALGIVVEGANTPAVCSIMFELAYRNT